ncbi:hypothetical protein WDZ16_10440 [Pseudokineococcus marinus]|uniref:hypothetical protein n=1 Tax=Pseudokineococcus marinus TaxID=351215 RepID=UPI0030A9F226
MRLVSWRHRLTVAAPCLLITLAALMALVEAPDGYDWLGASFAAVFAVLTVRALRLGVAVSDVTITDHALLWTPRYRLAEVQRIRSESFDWYLVAASYAPSKKHRQAVLYLTHDRRRRVRSVALGGRRTADLVNLVFDEHVAPRGRSAQARGQ